tara:strand:+ start:127 stop:294 length:168 start_codon:yes stop_codon:yes gene_type:complete
MINAGIRRRLQMIIERILKIRSNIICLSSILFKNKRDNRLKNIIEVVIIEGYKDF